MMTVCFFFYKTGGFVLFTKSKVMSHLQNRRFCLIFKDSGFVSLLKSAISLI